MSVFLSLLDDPLVNLAIERTLFDTFQLQGLFIWKNRPSVVIGRNQNPWQECHMAAMRAHKIDLCRRVSGGGSVFHDSHNINCSFFSYDTVFDRRRNLQIVQEACADMQIYLSQNALYDLLLNDCKVSGSAFRMEKHRALHHLTLLCRVNEDLLWKLLRRIPPAWQARGTVSRISKVGSLSDVQPDIAVSMVEKAIIAAYQRRRGGSQVHLITATSLPEGWQVHYQALSSWEWVIGKSPTFHMEIDDRQIYIEHGRIASMGDALSDVDEFANIIGYPLQYERYQIPHPVIGNLYRRLET